MRIKHNLILSILFTSSMLVGCNVDNKPLLSTPITMLAPDKKEALTPPTTYDYSYKLQTPPGETNPIWYFYNNNTGLYSLPYWERLGTSSPYNYRLLGYQIGADLDITINAYSPNNPWYLIGGNYYAPLYNNLGGYSTGSTVIKQLINVFNISNTNYRLWFDTNAIAAAHSNYCTYGGSITDNNFVYFTYPTSYAVMIMPAFSTITLWTYSSGAIINAIYFQKMPVTQDMAGYGNYNYNSGYSDGFNDGFESIDNLEWLENVATAVKDIFSVEIFPGFTVGFIVLFPLVVAIVKWFLSLFGIGGGGS